MINTDVALSDVLSGLYTLDADSPPESWVEVLQGAADRLKGRTALELEAAQNEILRYVKEMGLPRGPRLVDAAFGGRSKTELVDATQGRAVAIADLEPWPEAVDGAELLDEVASTIERYLVLPTGARDAIALWVVFTFAYSAFYVAPFLNIHSATKRSGKSTLLNLLKYLTRRAYKASSISPGALYRFVEAHRPTLLLDEADAWMTQNEELRGILNAGHTRSDTIMRCVGDSHEAREFSPWCPKAIAGIGDRAETITDRSITIEMVRRTSAEKVERLRLDRLEAGELEVLRRQIARWTQDHLSALADADPEVPAELHDRAADNCRPLFAIADAAGGDWPGRARDAAKQLYNASSHNTESLGEMLLRDLEVLFGDQEKLPTNKILSSLRELDDRPWSDWKGRGREGFTPHTLARLLKPYGIKPHKERDGTELWRGYRRADLADAFSRYLTPYKAEQEEQLSNGAKNPDHTKWNTRDAVPLRERGEKPRGACDVPHVPVPARRTAAEVLEL